MRCQHSMGLWMLITILMVGLLACNPAEPECYEPIDVKAQSRFVVKEVNDTFYMTSINGQDSIQIDTTITSYRDTVFNAVAMIALDTDSSIGFLGVRTAAVGVPLNPFTDSQRYRILFDTADIATADTVTFYYQPQEHFISNNCGYTHYFHLDSARSTFNFLDSVVLNETDITNDNSIRHLLLYFF